MKISYLFRQVPAAIMYDCKYCNLKKFVLLPPALGEIKKIQQVFHNLISNALRHTPKGGTVKISARQEGNQVAIEISDTGTGIPKSEHGKRFQKFARLEGER